MARDQVFISYSHADSYWLQRLEVMLTPLRRQGTLDVWADTRIQPGQVWKEEIQQALARAKVAVLLVSPDFLASEFIHTDELPPLLEAACTEGLIVLWIPVRHSLYRITPIAQYQAAYDPRTPLATLTPAQQDAALVQIAEALMVILPALDIPPAAPAPAPTPPLTSQGMSHSEPASIPAPSNESRPSPKHFSSPRPEPSRPAQSTPATLPAIQDIHGWPTQQVQELQRQTALALGLTVEFRDTLKDGSPGPEMVVIPAGEFLMGSPEDELERRDNEGPQHKVVIAKPFAIGRYTVTFEEYDRFCETTGNKKPGDEDWERGRRPVINVSWEEAVAYCAWLSQETSAAYRLPSEAEWEYATRAGTVWRFWWGATFCPKMSQCASSHTVPVDSFKPNPFGLYQVHGNVWEWVADVLRNHYQDAPRDGSAQTTWPVHTLQHTGTRDAIEKRYWNMPYSGGYWTGRGPPQETYSYTETVEDKSAGRVIRGGSWSLGPGWVRAAARTGYDPYGRNSGLGFRLARTFHR